MQQLMSKLPDFIFLYYFVSIGNASGQHAHRWMFGRIFYGVDGWINM